MSASDRRALQYARDRLEAAIAVLAHMERHAPMSERVYARKLREALALPDELRLTCSCSDCADRT